MAKRRIVYQNWATERTGPHEVLIAALDGLPQRDGQDNERVIRIEKAVRAALLKLEPLERLVIEAVHFHGKPLASLQAPTGKSPANLRKLHGRAIRRLKRELQGFVFEEFGLVPSIEQDCPLCRIGDRARIDAVLHSRSASDTWRPVIKRLRDEFSITRVMPSQIIGHLKYH